MSAGSWGEYRARCETAPVTHAARLIGDGGLVVLAPHPDDETFGASALFIEAGRSGRKVGIVALTDGEASHKGSKSVSRAELAAIRRAEQAAAVAALGVAHPEWLRLGLPDGGASRDARFASAAAAIASLCDRLGATALAAPHPDDPHPDHHAAGALAETVVALRPSLRLLLHPIWSPRLGSDAPYRSDRLLPFRVKTDVETKMKATACHRSQLGEIVTDDPDGFSLPDWFLKAQRAPAEIHGWAYRNGTLPDAAHFARLYADDGDPWHVRSSAYEANKRADNLDQLAGRSYRRGLDLACGEGHLAAALTTSGTVAEMVALDRDASIIARARSVHAGNDRLTFRTGSLPFELPDGPFDFAVVSEVLYFLDEDRIAALADALASRLSPGGDILLVSYLGPTDTPLSGRDAQDLFAACLGERVTPVTRRDRPGYRAELFRKGREAG
ncbi:bifunctional PIG-L family deacetylase/class I SAM-dependent methyltransferase [Fulvimarina sp. 2208YS6-2-32]|uniref:Bifunctional PIG-L family deacetylase/class I SAM-dependent methyltransferase n=1 Tax=Fulvimarina uroteuthidis TaxID=3098149 RepID=A0ABU5HYD8_9HYPH|nr:bifunctional PIG-L family deacetylase/class I SAM-dependent methyltransferase [Fulvimarina sp. 2208YS6-2-32]MDY8108149.1 bifunctional PIG-L family deacetylase/class I SAM-dependent methyltransferase [Fulvimarina sp. 2208YS6-2-32]